MLIKEIENKKKTGWEWRTSEVYEQVLSRFKKPFVLDVGSNDGRKGAQVYFKKGVSSENYYAADVDEKALKKLSDLGANTVVKNLCDENLSFEDLNLTFDVGLIVEVLEHLAHKHERARIIDSTISVLKIGAHLAMTFPIKPGIDGRKFGHKNKVMDPKEIYDLVESHFEEINVYKTKTTYAIFCFNKE